MKWNMLIGSLMLGASLCTPSFGGGLLDRMLGLKGSGCDSSCCDTGCAADPSCGCEVNACDPCAKKGCGLLSKLKGPSCGCEVNACDPCNAAPSCGCEVNACDPCAKKGCGLLGKLKGPSCGCEVNACDPCNAAPSCGCEMNSCGPATCDTCCKPRRKPLLELLGRVEKAKMDMLRNVACKVRNVGKGCDTCCDTGCGCGAAPTCGCEVNACDPCKAAPTCGCEISACDPCGCDSGCGKKKGLLSKLFAKKSCCDTGCDTGCSSCSSCGTSTSAPAPAPAAASAAPMPPAPVVDPSAYLNSNRRVIQATSYVR